MRDEDERAAARVLQLENRFRICAWIETSSAETGSSATSTVGSRIIARAIADPLLLPAREHVRIAARVLRREPDRHKHARSRSRRAARASAVLSASGSSSDLRDGLPRIERSVGVLEHHLHARAQPRSRAFERPSASMPSIRSAPSVGGSTSRDQPRERRLAAARLADDPERAPGGARSTRRSQHAPSARAQSGADRVMASARASRAPAPTWPPALIRTSSEIARFGSGGVHGAHLVRMQAAHARLERRLRADAIGLHPRAARREEAATRAVAAAGTVPARLGRRRTPASVPASDASSARYTDAAAARRARRRGRLDDLPGVHHRRRGAPARRRRQVVRDENERDAELRAALRAAQDLRLHGDVERRRGLVGDQQRGSRASAMAISTRWRMPPESWCG